MVVVFSGVVAFFAVPYLVPKIFFGFNGAENERLILLTRILLLSPILLGVSNYFASITQLYKRFLVYALTPVLYNIGIIVGTVLFARYIGNIGIVIGVVLGAVLHMAIQVPFIIKEELFPRLKFPIAWARIRNVIFLSVPRTITLALNHVAILILLSTASFMQEGSVAIFNFSWNLQSVPLTIIGMSYSLAAFPMLSLLFAQKEMKKFLSEIIEAARHIIFWSLPLVALFVVLRAQIVRTVLGASTNFDWSDTRLTAAAFAIFTISVLAQSIILLFVRGFYAAGKTKIPLLINFISALGIIGASYLFNYLFSDSILFKTFLERLLRVENITGTAVLVLPLAYSAGMILNSLLLWLFFERQFRGFSRPVLSTLYHSFAASVIIGAGSYVGLNFFDDVFDTYTAVGIFMQGLCAGLVGVVAGVGMLKLLKNRELSEILRALHGRIWKVKVIGPEVTENIST